MGNQQSAGLEFCNASQLYTSRNETSISKLDMDTRIAYSLSTEPKFQLQRVQKAHQQVPPQQQEQECIKERPVDLEQDACKQATLLEDKKKLSTAAQSICSVEKGAMERSMKQVVHSKWVEGAEVTELSEDDLKVFEGVFGNVIINQSGLVLYTDIAGKKYCEEYDRDQICKIFPMGISQGGLSKSIWFKDITAREDCFDLMSTLRPPSYNTILANPSKFALPKNDEAEDDDEDLMKVFEGIKDRNVIVHADNIVLYTDIAGDKHCEHYDKHKIKKCFPNGIHCGGLSKTIWFDDDLERDLCFMLMQWDKEREPDVVVKETVVREFAGLNGNVVLHPDSQIEYTSHNNDRVKCVYKPREIKECFPKGISYGRLPVTIWFRDIIMRDRCIEAMRNI